MNLPIAYISAVLCLPRLLGLHRHAYAIPRAGASARMRLGSRWLQPAKRKLADLG